MTVTAIIVTYNRQKDLLRCINAVLKQTKRPDNLLIINNASTDDTIGMINQMFGDFEDVCHFEQDVILKAKYINSIPIYLVNKSVNTGGSGGFYIGLKIAHQYLSTDYYWMMDDDGYPSEDCLKQQLIFSEKYDYVMPVSIDVENTSQMSWPTVLKNGGKSILYHDVYASWGSVMDYVYPFNGSLLSKNIVDKVGYINKDFFIWGDEYEHYWRCKRQKFHPVTITNAIFYHPANKMSFVPILFGLIKVPFSESKVRMICLARNYTYIYWNYDNKMKIVYKLFVYTWLYLVTRKLDYSGYKLYLYSVFDGFKGNFTRHLNYL